MRTNQNQIAIRCDEFPKHLPTLRPNQCARYSARGVVSRASLDYSFNLSDRTLLRAAIRRGEAKGGTQHVSVEVESDEVAA